MKKILNLVKILVLALILAIGVSYVSAAWSDPLGIAPNDNAPAPINVSSADQNKTGALGLGGLSVFGQFKLMDGTEGVGKVLTSDASGLASWKDPGNLGGNGGETPTPGVYNVKWVQLATDSNATINIPAGTNKLIVTATAEMYRQLPGDSGRTVVEKFKANGNVFATAQIGAGNNNGAQARWEGSTTGVVDVTNKNSVTFSTEANILGSTGKMKNESCPETVSGTLYSYNIPEKVSGLWQYQTDDLLESPNELSAVGYDVFTNSNSKINYSSSLVDPKYTYLKSGKTVTVSDGGVVYLDGGTVKATFEQYLNWATGGSGRNVKFAEYTGSHSGIIQKCSINFKGYVIIGI